MLGSPILYLKGMRILMFQLSGFYCKAFRASMGCCRLGVQYVLLLQLGGGVCLFLRPANSNAYVFS